MFPRMGEFPYPFRLYHSRRISASVSANRPLRPGVGFVAFICLYGEGLHACIQHCTIAPGVSYPFRVFIGSQSDVPTKVFPIISSVRPWIQKDFMRRLSGIMFSNLCYYEPLLPGGGSTLAGRTPLEELQPLEGIGRATAHVFCISGKGDYRCFFHFLWLDIPLTLTTRTVTSLSCSTLQHASSITP